MLFSMFTLKFEHKDSNREQNVFLPFEIQLLENRIIFNNKKVFYIHEFRFL
jgi:hypothetical protein